MGFLRNLLDNVEKKWFAKGAPLERLYPIFEAADTLFYSPGKVTKTPSLVRDGADLKRVMITVVIALLPATFMGIYNVGLQANLAIAGGAGIPEGWRTAIVSGLGFGFSPDDVVGCAVHGLIYYLPVLIVTFAVGLGWELLFCIVRKEEINEGFFVTGFLFPMIVPPSIPLWQVALAISFGVVIGKEVFGGTGYNILNPALTSRAFLFFGYPAQISGNAVWVAADGYTRATPLAEGFESGMGALTANPDMMWNAFIGTIPGCMGETSALACFIGAIILIVTGVGSWRIMAAVTVGTLLTVTMFNAIGSETNQMMAMPFIWHIILGGWALGTVFMTTDPVSGAQSNLGRYIYGFLIGFFVVVVRVLNPAYPEGMMMCILLMNVFAPLIDYYVVRAHVKRRKARYA
ncbi:MAG: NADH:ubiquinone reductase (Na(+)-transporting) subunit B [Myxococcota bacterium]|nr:NADH:ubiquinone reductase (Na(+)-transporting) subunit B [Myxococcota bacterium]